MSPHLGASTKAAPPIAWTATLLLVLWAGSVAYLTLSPTAYTPPLTVRSFLCLACGDLDGSDIIRNWILFIPGGVFAALAVRVRRGMPLPIILTCTIEFLQIGVPGRDPALQDLMSNTLGAVTGYMLVRHGLPSQGQRLVTGTALAAWLAPLVLLIPLTTPFDLYGQWTPSFATLEHFDGRILDARVGDVALESRRTREKEALDAAIRARAPIRLRMAIEQRPESWAPVLQVVDDRRQGVVELGALNSDLILRGRNPARLLRLDQPDVRWYDAMSGITRGDTATLLIERGRNSVCMSWDGREQCGLAPSLADGWAFVLNLERAPRWLRELLSLMWAAGLGTLIGMTLPTARSAVAVATAAALLGYLGASLSPDVRPDALHALLLSVGAIAGAWSRGPIAALWRTLGPG